MKVLPDDTAVACPPKSDLKPHPRTVQDSGCRVQGAGFRVEGAGRRVQGAATHPVGPQPAPAQGRRAKHKRGGEAGGVPVVPVESLGFRVSGSGLRVSGLGVRVKGAGFRVEG